MGKKFLHLWLSIQRLALFVSTLKSVIEFAFPALFLIDSSCHIQKQLDLRAAAFLGMKISLAKMGHLDIFPDSGTDFLVKKLTVECWSIG